MSFGQSHLLCRLTSGKGPFNYMSDLPFAFMTGFYLSRLNCRKVHISFAKLLQYHVMFITQFLQGRQLHIIRDLRAHKAHWWVSFTITGGPKFNSREQVLGLKFSLTHFSLKELQAAGWKSSYHSVCLCVHTHTYTNGCALNTPSNTVVGR